MISFARKKEVERQTFPLWLANFAVSKLSGQESISYSDFLSAVNGERKEIAENPASRAPSKRSGEEIMAEFMPIIEAQRGG